MKLEYSTPVVEVGLKFCKGSWTQKKVSEFYKKHLKKVDGHISQNTVFITIKMETIVKIF